MLLSDFMCMHAVCVGFHWHVFWTIPSVSCSILTLYIVYRHLQIQRSHVTCIYVYSSSSSSSLVYFCLPTVLSLFTNILYEALPEEIETW